jgi:hypothetical protein
MATETENTVIEYRLKVLEDAVTDIRAAVKGIDQSLATLARLEERHAETRDGLGRAFKAIEKVDGRVKSIEVEIPTLKLTRGWVITFTVGCVGLVLLAVAKLVITH